MPFDLSSLDGRHLFFSYAAVFLIQGGYLLYVVTGWAKLRREQSVDSNSKKATRPV